MKNCRPEEKGSDRAREAVEKWAYTDFSRNNGDAARLSYAVVETQTGGVDLFTVESIILRRL